VQLPQGVVAFSFGFQWILPRGVSLNWLYLQGQTKIPYIIYFKIFYVKYVRFPLVLVAPEDAQLRPKHVEMPNH
jgi:hypothetical protein